MKDEVEIGVVEDVDDKSDADILVEVLEENQDGFNELAEGKLDKNEKATEGDDVSE